MDAGRTATWVLLACTELAAVVVGITSIEKNSVVLMRVAVAIAISSAVAALVMFRRGRSAARKRIRPVSPLPPRPVVQTDIIDVTYRVPQRATSGHAVVASR